MCNSQAIKKYYQETWENIKKNRFSYSTSWQLSQRLTELADEIVIKTCQSAGETDGIAVLALGGYAREQMAPFSDIDILILHKGKMNKNYERFISEFTTFMWDIGVNPGIQVKELKEVAKAALEDEVVRTSFIDNRFIFGSRKEYEAFLKIINEKVMEKGKHEFLLMKIDGVRNRNSKFRDSIFRLQPNIKEGNGGMRDINTIYWICKILYKTKSLHETVKHNILTNSEYEKLIENAEFMFRVRNELHYYHNRKYDVMSLEAQMEIAKNLGYTATSSVQSVEIFMRDYYIMAKSTSEITQKVINRTLAELSHKWFQKKVFSLRLSDGFVQYANTLTVESKNIFDENPRKLISVFTYAANKGLKLADSTIDLIKERTYLIDSEFTQKYGSVFLKAISSFPESSRIVSNMAKCGVLQAIIPEFEYIICRAQFDYYHHYTVDEHTYLALSYLDKLTGTLPPHLERYQEAFNRLKRKDLLALALLLHDIGKGQGKNHSIVGAQMARSICKFLGMGLEDTDTVCSMVEHHLLMSHIAQRRDLHSIDVINHFISYVNNQQELDILFLLTYADMNAVGGAAFNEWKNSLLKELHEKAEQALNNEDLVKEYNAVVKLRREKLEERCKLTPEIYEASKTLDEEFIYANKAGQIISYLSMALKINENNRIIVEVDTREELDTMQILVCTYDHVGLLRKICGALASLGYNIKWAQIYTMNNDITIDNILVDNPFAGSKIPDSKKELLINRIIDTINGATDIEKLLERSSNSILAQPKLMSKKEKITFDNEVSSQYTVIDIYAQDRLGLLYSILGVFNRMGISVDKAKISTDVDRVVDSFYLTDTEGRKLTDSAVLEDIKKELFKEIESRSV
ncbi:MAG: [protein-PII] uridylyltransferase [Deferribacterales bacterium]